MALISDKNKAGPQYGRIGLAMPPSQYTRHGLRIEREAWSSVLQLIFPCPADCANSYDFNIKIFGK